MTSFADDSVIRYGNDLAVLIIEMEKSLEAITKWLKKSGLKVIESDIGFLGSKMQFSVLSSKKKPRFATLGA